MSVLVRPTIGTAGGGGAVSQEFDRPDQSGYAFGPLTSDDPEGISDLIRRMSNDSQRLRLRDKSPAYYRWMYLQNPAGPAVVHSARLDGEVVASFAMAPKLFQIDGEQVVLGKTMDMFTDPAHQGRGLIRRCTAEVFEGARDAGIRDWYVTPSVQSYPIFKRWGYREDIRLVHRTRVLRWSPVLGAMLKPAVPARLAGRVIDRLRDFLTRRRRPLPKGWTLDTMDRFGPEADRLWERVADGYRVAIMRDATYLNWRYVENPDEYTVLGLRAAGELVGLVVLGETTRRGVRVCEVMDFVCPAHDDSIFGLLMEGATEHARSTGHALVQAWSIRGTALDRRIRRAGLWFNRTDIKFLLSPEADHQALSDPEAWLLTQGDGNDV